MVDILEKVKETLTEEEFDQLNEAVAKAETYDELYKTAKKLENSLDILAVTFGRTYTNLILAQAKDE